MMSIKTDAPDLQVQQAAAAFTRQSALFDDLYLPDTIVQYKRERVRMHVIRYLPPQGSILELNAGTGEDAIYFARKGHRVHATDISSGMQQVLAGKVKEARLENRISYEPCSFTELERLRQKGPFDLVFSNLAGLNCTPDLDKVLAAIEHLLKPGAILTLVLLPKFCLWESLLVFKGYFKTAFRRFSGSSGAPAQVEGIRFRCWYYNPSYITRRLDTAFSLLSIEGLCAFVPPSYIRHFPEKHPRLYRFLQRKEDRLKSRWPWRSVGDYYIISMRKKN